MLKGGTPWTPEFMAEYDAAKGQAVPTTSKGITPGTWRWLCVRYFAECADYLRLDERTKRVRRGILEATFDEPIAPGSSKFFREFPLARMTAEAIEVLRDRKLAFPEGANNRLKAIRAVLRWAVRKKAPHGKPLALSREKQKCKGKSRLRVDDGPVLLFANSVVHAQHLSARLCLSGVPAASIYADTDVAVRQYFIRQFLDGRIKVLANYQVLATGFDAPKTATIVISRPVFSPVRYMQMVGRGLRGPKNGGTETCKIITVVDNLVQYGDRLAYHYFMRHYS